MTTLAALTDDITMDDPGGPDQSVTYPPMRIYIFIKSRYN